MCNKHMTLMTKIRNNLDKYRCYLRQNGRKCSNEGNIYKESIFKSSRLDIEDLLILLCKWVKGVSNCGIPQRNEKQNIVNKKFNINDHDNMLEHFYQHGYVRNVSAIIELDIDSSTVSRWFTRFNNAVFLSYFNYLQNKTIGGLNCVVEIDETLLVKVKTITVESINTKFGLLVKTTLVDLIKRKIEPGSTIITDCWRGYEGFSELCPDYNYLHFTVNYNQNFVNPTTGAHTQTIVGMLSVIKRELRKEGTSHGSLKNLIRKLYIARFKLIIRESLLERMLCFFEVQNIWFLNYDTIPEFDLELIE
ncbi:reverse transcriptase [Vairimorpha necatrix]|uniref:Reverse transcriptase n=1 Tax=Vairimorpha necatrix TaxID=6039 RepID=A0AAX4JGA2_9MICR